MTEVAENTVLLDLDKLPAANGAEFDSYMNQYESECLAGTSTELLRQVVEWAKSPQRGKSIFLAEWDGGNGEIDHLSNSGKIFQT